MKTGKRTRKPRKLPISWSNTGEIAELLTQYHDERDRRPMKNPLPPVNWERIAEKVNERFGNRRNARECAKWFVGMVSNHQPWHPYELEMLELVVTQVFSRPWMGKPVMWREVSNVLRADHGFTRSPAACERQHDRPGQNVPRQPVRWAQDEKDALLTLADTRFPRDCSQRERDRWAEIAKTHNKEFGADRSWRSCNAAYGREALMRKRRHAPKRHQLNSGA